MKKIDLLIILLLLCIPACCFATEIPLENGAGQILQQGNTIHIVSDEYTEEGGDQKICRILTEDHKLIPCDGKCVSLWTKVVEGEQSYYQLPARRIIIASEEGSFFLDNDGHVLQWMPEEDGIWKQRCTLDLEGTDVDLADEEAALYYRFINGTLYLGYTKNQQGTLYGFSLENGSRTLLYRAVSIDGIYRDNGDEILLLTNPKFQHFHPVDKKATLYSFGFQDLWTDIRPDGQGNYLYLGYSGLHSVDQQLAEKTLYQLPQGVLPRTSLYYRPSTQEYLFATYDKDGQNKLHLVKMDHAQQNVLHLVDTSNELDSWSPYVPPMEEFYASHDQFRIERDTNIADYDQLSQQLVLGGDAFDVMLVDGLFFDLADLYKKGYFVDLSGVEEIAGYVASAYPVFRDACMAENQIAAMPVIAQEEIMMINQPLWEELELPVPATFGELLDTIAYCLDEGILDEYPLFQSDRLELDSRGQIISMDRMAPTECYNTLSAHLMRQYIANCQRDGELTFRDDTFLALMDKLRSMKARLDQHDANRVVGEALLYPSGDLSTVCGAKRYDQSAFRPLLLGVRNEQDIAVPVRLKVMLINPYSPRVELAKEYMAYFAAHPTSTTRCVITTEQPDGIEKPGSHTNKESDENFEKDMLSRIEAAKVEDDLLTVRDLEEQLARFKEYRSVNWDVMPESAQAYYQIIPYLVVMDSESFGFITENGSRDIAAFDEGRIDAKTLCQRLEQLLMMRRMENQ